MSSTPSLEDYKEKLHYFGKVRADLRVLSQLHAPPVLLFCGLTSLAVLSPRLTRCPVITMSWCQVEGEIDTISTVHNIGALSLNTSSLKVSFKVRRRGQARLNRLVP